VNVLIVDDNEAAADLLQELLTLQDHTARCTYTARQALEAAANESFDAALIDLTLPDLPGTEVARQLRASTAPGTPRLLVAISGFSAAGRGRPGGRRPVRPPPAKADRHRQARPHPGAAGALAAPPVSTRPALSLSLPLPNLRRIHSDACRRGASLSAVRAASTGKPQGLELVNHF
jgi:CheY-like chemotaxis protein